MARRAQQRSALDLFGEIPVTWPEVWSWVEAVAGLERTSWRARYYVEHWNVPAKIRAAKAAGTFDRIVEVKKSLPDALPHVERGTIWTAEGSRRPSTAYAFLNATTATRSATRAIQ